MVFSTPVFVFTVRMLQVTKSLPSLPVPSNASCRHITYNDGGISR
jgi:hypothetical protein